MLTPPNTANPQPGKPTTKLTAADQKALENIKKREAEELAKCKKLTNNTTLTSEEYSNADEDFRVLVETPWQKQEPIYIMPELDDNTGKLHPKLKSLVENIRTGKPYHTFITGSWGETWPLLLRLCYGLKSEPKFKISIEQLHSLIQVSYWRETKLELKSINIFERDQKTLSASGKTFLSNIFPELPGQQSTALIAKIDRNQIPQGETAFLRIELNELYFNFSTTIAQTNPLTELAPILFGWSRFTREKTNALAKENAADMLVTMMHSNVWPYRLMLDEKKLCLCLPSQSFLKIYHEIINPQRKVKNVRRLGLITASLQEKHSDKNERPFGLRAPGITSPSIYHEMVCLPAFEEIHDGYHAELETRTSNAIFSQMQRAKLILRKNTEAKYTYEIFRCIDREAASYLDEKQRFLRLITRTFATSIIKKDSKPANSAVLVLIDMILHPEFWPYYSGMKEKIITALLGKNIATEGLEKTVRKNYEMANKNESIVAMLVLFHFHLNDEKLCHTILASLQAQTFTTQLIWKKDPTSKGLKPIFVCNGRENTLEDIKKAAPEKRIILLTPTIYPLPQTTDSIQLKKYIDIINANSGKVIIDKDLQKMTTFSLDCLSLTKNLRTQLNLDRLLITNPKNGQLEYLKTKVPNVVIELNPDPEKPNSYLCTFLASERKDVENILNPKKYQELSAICIQAYFRGYLGRNKFFTETKKQCQQKIATLKTEITQATDAENFDDVSSLAQKAKKEAGKLATVTHLITKYSR